MEGVGGQRQGGGSTAEEPVRVETRRRLKIQRWFSNQASRSRERQWRRSLQWIRTLHWDLAMYGPFIPAEIQLEGIQEGFRMSQLHPITSTLFSRKQFWKCFFMISWHKKKSVKVLMWPLMATLEVRGKDPLKNVVIFEMFCFRLHFTIFFFIIIILFVSFIIVLNRRYIQDTLSRF